MFKNARLIPALAPSYSGLAQTTKKSVLSQTAFLRVAWWCLCLLRKHGPKPVLESSVLKLFWFFNEVFIAEEMGTDNRQDLGFTASRDTLPELGCLWSLLSSKSRTIPWTAQLQKSRQTTASSGLPKQFCGLVVECLKTNKRIWIPDTTFWVPQSDCDMGYQCYCSPSAILKRKAVAAVSLKKKNTLDDWHL